MPEILAHLPDGKTVLHFPDGTDRSVIDSVVQQHLGGQYTEAGAAIKPPVQPLPNENMQPVMSWSQPSKFETDVGKGMGFDVGKIEAASGKGMPKNKEVIRQIISGVRGFAKSVAKDPYHITDPITGMAAGIEQAKSPGEMMGALSNVAMGMEASGVKKPTPAVVLKSEVANAAYKRGLGVAERLKSADRAIADHVSERAQSVIQKVDSAHPEGVIDPKTIMDRVNQVKDEIVKTPEKYPSGIASMLEPDIKQSTGPRIMGGHLDLSDPQQLASYQKLKAQGAFTPAEISRMEASSSELWSAETAKQWRTKIGAAMTKAQGPMKAVLQGAYDDLTNQLRKAADENGALQDFTDYNNLHKKHLRFLNDSTVSKIMEGTTSKETLGPLSDPEKMAHVDNLLADWDKYGIKTEELAKEGADYTKAKAVLAQKHLRIWPYGTAGGLLGSHLLGIPYPIGAAAGILVDRAMSGAGKASRFIEQSKVSPFYQAGEAKAATIGRGFEDLPDIPAKKVAIKGKK